MTPAQKWCDLGISDHVMPCLYHDDLCVAVCLFIDEQKLYISAIEIYFIFVNLVILVPLYMLFYFAEIFHQQSVIELFP